MMKRHLLAAFHNKQVISARASSSRSHTGVGNPVAFRLHAPKQLWTLLVLTLALLIAGCGGQPERALPTLASLPTHTEIVASTVDESETEQPALDPTPTREELLSATAATATVTTTATATATTTSIAQRVGPTLPPTYTPTASPTPFASDTPTPQPEGFSPDGTLYYIYNDDTIMRLAADGSQQTAIRTFAGSRISDLTPSPDGTILAFVAPGRGTAREIWATSRDGNWLQQITCLNYEELHSLDWTPDSQSIVFFGAQTPDGPFRIYAANWIGANDCPFGNRQRVVYRQEIERPGGLSYSHDARYLAFSDGLTHVLDLRTQTVSSALTTSTGFGRDFALAFSPADSELLAYIRPGRSAPGARISGTALGIRLDLAADPLRATSDFDAGNAIQDIAWNPDGNTLLTSTDDSVFVFDVRRRVGSAVIIGTAHSPRAVFSPSGERIAYVDAGADGSGPQVHITNIGGTNRAQVSSHEEGNSISDLMWLPG